MLDRPAIGAAVGAFTDGVVVLSNVAGTTALVPIIADVGLAPPQYSPRGLPEDVDPFGGLTSV